MTDPATASTEPPEPARLEGAGSEVPAPRSPTTASSVAPPRAPSKSSAPRKAPSPRARPSAGNPSSVDVPDF